ncbi:hypothetical protein DFP72DRAFT_861430 [Ephemerocybe angulata]|uniref:C2H2-type domain-containing protein n=1 Tax=Ephemerocybe angulata TaxID=980116 RepID=A0A8H6H8F8_9AGAR|nr:hypothetical protein DFP72DRAFT_861430 [Tulosesus angulatus]
MRLSLIALIPLTAFLSVVHARSDYTYEAREHIDELATRAFEGSVLTTRQDLADLSTRDLLNELGDRLQRRLGDKRRFLCVTCSKHFVGAKNANKHVETLQTHTNWIFNKQEVTPPF